MSRFVKLGDALKKELSDAVVLPERPSKEIKFFDSTKFDNKYLKSRQIELQRWMRALALIPEVLSSSVFQDFFREDNDETKTRRRFHDSCHASADALLHCHDRKTF